MVVVVGDGGGFASFPTMHISPLLPVRPIICRSAFSPSVAPASRHCQVKMKKKKTPFTHYLFPFTLRDLQMQIACSPSFFSKSFEDSEAAAIVPAPSTFTLPVLYEQKIPSLFFFFRKLFLSDTGGTAHLFSIKPRLIS